MKLYLVRHGKAEPGGVDEERLLTSRGRGAVERVSTSLIEMGVQIGRMEHSGLVRARQTAEILALAVGGSPLEVPDLAPEADVKRIARRVTDAGEDVMLVGHVPFMSRLASYLLSGDSEPPLLHFRTASIACLSNDEDSWILEWFITPNAG